MSMTLLRAADPAATLEPDPSSDGAQQLLRGIVSVPTSRPRRAGVPARSVRRLAVAAVLTGAAAIAGVVALTSSDGPQVGPAGYTVTTGRDGTVRAVMRWSMLSDPASLQAALDRAGARVKIFVEPDSPGLPLCTRGTTSSYSTNAVEWHAPDRATDSGLVVHPDKFPARGTFVVVVTMAQPGSSVSTLGPGYPAITSTLTYMQLGAVPDPVC